MKFTFPKLNLTVRKKNPYFWIALIGVILSAMNVSPETFTSWEAVGTALYNLVKNPYMLGCVFLAVMGVFIDPTTNGVSDSKQALTYTSPKKEE